MTEPNAPAAARNPRAILTQPAPPPDRVLRYGEHADAVMDLYLPSSGAADAPLIIMLHGGYWRAKYDRVHMRPFADALRRDGFAVVLPEYRRVGGEGVLAGGYPATFDDVHAGLEALPALLAAQGLLPRHVTLGGHSAGGQLAMWAAMEAPAFDRVVALAPVSDLHAAYAEALDERAVEGLLGGSPEQFPERYARTDPMLRLVQPACAVRVVHGDIDDRVPVEHSRRLVARHPWLEYDEIAGCEHFGLIDPGSAAWPVVHAALTRD